MRAPPPHTVSEYTDYPGDGLFKVQNDIQYISKKRDRLLFVIKIFMSNKIKLFKNSVQ